MARLARLRGGLASPGFWLVFLGCSSHGWSVSAAWRFCGVPLSAVRFMAGLARGRGGFAILLSWLLAVWLVWLSGAEGSGRLLPAAWFTVGLVKLYRRVHVRFDPSVETSCPVYPVLAHSYISFCLSICSLYIELPASLTTCRHIQDV